MKKYLEILRKCPLFQEISDENLISMLGCLGASVHAYEKNEIIFSEGDTADSFGIVLLGTVQIAQVDYYGNRSIVANIEKTQIFGESFACAGAEVFPVDIIAKESCTVMLVDVHRVIKSCSNACSFHNQIIFNLMKIVAAKNLLFHQKIEITSKRSTREKLMTYLLTEAKKHTQNTFEIPYDRQELADYLEVDRSGLSAEISKLRKEGILKAEKNRFTLVKPEQTRI